MTSHEILRADVLDILFQDRNKQYGAYALRREYPARLGTALGLTLSAFLLLYLVLDSGSGATSASRQAKPDVVLTTVVMPPPEALAPPPPPPPAPARTEAAATTSLTTQIELVERVDPDHEMEEVRNMQHLAVGSVNRPGVPDSGSLVPRPPAPAPAAAGTGNEPESFTAVQKQPEFPGGTAAWLRFLEKNLQTPSDLLPGEKKTVLIGFVVDEEGSVTGYRVVQSGGRDFDAEVMRVLRKMPRWSPAIQNGKPVAVGFTQPVTFVGLEN